MRCNIVMEICVDMEGDMEEIMDNTYVKRTKLNREYPIFTLPL
jgi:hypothetical protein